MWMCNNGKKVITGSLRDLLVAAGHEVVTEMTSLMTPRDIDLRNTESMEEIVKELVNEDEIIADVNHVFEKMSPFEKIYAIHYVLTHLFNKRNKAPKLRMWMEAAIDVLFEMMKSNVICEIDGEGYEYRKLIIKCLKENFSEKEDPGIYEKDSEKISSHGFWDCEIDNLKSQVLSENFEYDLEISESGKELDGENLPSMKVEKKAIIRMIRDIFKMD